MSYLFYTQYLLFSIHPTLSSHNCAHKSILYICTFIPALQISSSVTFFKIPYICINTWHLLNSKIPLSMKSKVEAQIISQIKVVLLLFMITRTWKQPRCPLRDEWIKKLWYKLSTIHNICSICCIKCYQAIKRNEFESVQMRWMNLGHVIQSEVSQRKTKIVY